jgi:hypothetical protein
LSWGTWNAHLNYNYQVTNKNGQTHPGDPTNTFASGWWVTGEVTSAEDLDVLAANTATATYNGTAWGTVASNLASGGWKTYDASGDLKMNWSFASRSGDLAISKFDANNFNGGLSFSGPMCAPGAGCGTAAGNHFGGPLTGNLPANLGSLRNHG